MIIELTFENLLKNGCNEQEANELFNTTGDYNLQCNNGKFFVSKLENKFYTGIDYHRKVNFNYGSLSFPVNCPDLIPEYYNLALYNFVEKQKKSLGLLYNEVNQTEKFIINEIKRSKDIIDNAKESFTKRTTHKFESKELIVNVYESYIYFLEAIVTKQPKVNKPQQTTINEIEIWKSEYELRQFIDTATRWSVKSVFDSRTENNNYSIFDYEVKNSRKNFEVFCIQLNTKLTENANWKAIEIDLKDRFLGMINQFIKWYELNKQETEIFNPNNPYEIMFLIIESTKNEILKYFPDTESKNQPQQSNTNNPDEVKKIFSFTNNFDNIEETKVFKYFENKLVVPKFIDIKTLHEFLLIAFDKNELPKKQFSFNKLNTKKQIIKIFYDYYNNVAGKPHGKQAKYVELLGNYFEGFDAKSIKTNFNK